MHKTDHRLSRAQHDGRSGGSASGLLGRVTQAGSSLAGGPAKAWQAAKEGTQDLAELAVSGIDLAGQGQDYRRWRCGVRVRKSRGRAFIRIIAMPRRRRLGEEALGQLAELAAVPVAHVGQVAFHFVAT